MLAYLQGIIKERQNGEMIVLTGSEAQGFVGYQVRTPDHPRYDVLIPGSRSEVYLYSHVREDAFDLYGFLTSAEKHFFTTLLSVSGVGPRMALSLLSHTDETSLIEMILTEDKAALTGISGVGKKTAERMVLELKDNIQKKVDSGLFLRKNAAATTRGAGAAGGATGSNSGPIGAKVDRSSRIFMEAYLALQGLGFKELQARQMVEGALQVEQPPERVEDLVKAALQGGM
ncbi:Holliday junction branch migration protein RuvA [bacterium]|jgi:Holliday junction DNA helicase RuvA|nr:Holliday junction branch migration protein RuvA [bacterium]